LAVKAFLETEGWRRFHQNGGVKKIVERLQAKGCVVGSGGKETGAEKGVLANVALSLIATPVEAPKW